MLNALWGIGISLVICGWWYGRNYLLYGEILPIQAFNRAFGGTALAEDVASGRLKLPVSINGWGDYMLHMGQWTFQSFWAVYGTPKSARSGWFEFLPDQIYALFGALSAAMAAGLTVLHFKRKTVFSETQRCEIWLLFAVTALVSLSFFGFILHYFQGAGPLPVPGNGSYRYAWKYGLAGPFSAKIQRGGVRRTAAIPIGDVRDLLWQMNFQAPLFAAREAR